MTNTNEYAQYTHGVRGEILRSRYDSSNGGISAAYDDVIIVGPDVPAMHPVRSDTAVVVIGKTTPTYFVLRPAAAPGPGRTPYMFGGTYVRSSGNSTEWEQLFGTHLPIPLHDRTETWAQHGHLCT